MITVFLLFAIPLLLIGLFAAGVFKLFSKSSGFYDLADHVKRKNK